MRQKYYYKLTDQNMCTYGGYQWELGVWHYTSGEGPLCTKGWLHVYSSPLLAILLNPIHAGFDAPHLFKCEVRGRYKDDNGLKQGWSEVKLVKELKVPILTKEHKVKFAILCAKAVCCSPNFMAWADNWLNNIDRSTKSAAEAAAWAAEEVKTAQAAAWAAEAAAWAAEAAAEEEEVKAEAAAAWAAEAAEEVKAATKLSNLKKIAIEAIS